MIKVPIEKITIDEKADNIEQENNTSHMKRGFSKEQAGGNICGEKDS